MSLFCGTIHYANAIAHIQDLALGAKPFADLFIAL
jgi:hypothetical protein